MQRKFSTLIFIAGFALTVFTAAAQREAPSVLNPREYKSPSGDFVLVVDPSDLYGRGAADYRVTKKSMTIWEGKKPFTLHEAGITDKGLIGGYAYTHGIEGYFRESGNDGSGEFHTVIMRATGEVLLDEVTRRTGSRYLHTPPNPVAQGLLFDGTKDRMVVVVNDANVNRRKNSHWTYQLSSAKRLGKVNESPNIPAIAPPAETQPVELPEFPNRPLKLLGTLNLQDGGASTSSPIRDIWSFDFNSHGEIGFIRKDAPKRFAFVLIAPDGTLIREVTVGIPDELVESGFPKTAWVEGDRWVVASSRFEVEAKASAWWLNASNGALTTIKGFDSPRIQEITGSRDGGFVALASHRSQYTMEAQLIAFDLAGKVRWKLKQNNAGGPDALFSPQDIAVTTDSRVAVLDVIRHTVQFFRTNGNFLNAIKLDDAWGRKPNYPSGIVADKEGGVLVKDFRGKPPMVRMDASAKVITEFQPKHPDGRIIDAIRGVKVDDAGRVWVCDGECFVRLGDAGVADRVLGAAPSQEKLGRIATLTIDTQGRLYAVDDRSGAVHVYDPAGARLRICKPDPTDVKSKLFRPHIAASTDGTVSFTDGEGFPGNPRYIQYAPDGHRIGTKQFGLDPITEHWYGIPNSSKFLVVGYQSAFLTDADGNVARIIKRRPDRNWLELTRGASVAPNGSFAILSGGSHSSGKHWQVNLYSADGEPVRMVTMPGALMDSWFTYSGRHLAMRTESEICVFKDTGDPLLKFSPPVEDFKDIKSQRWSCFTAGEGRELWLAAIDRKSLWRFELP